MKFKKKLIKCLKNDPDVFNEVRSEIITSYFKSEQQKEIKFINNPQETDFLENRTDEEIIDGIFTTLKYYIEYEKEIEERGV